jgi:hypothetical protein
MALNCPLCGEEIPLPSELSYIDQGALDRSGAACICKECGDRLKALTTGPVEDSIDGDS